MLPHLVTPLGDTIIWGPFITPIDTYLGKMLQNKNRFLDHFCSSHLPFLACYKYKICEGGRELLHD